MWSRVVAELLLLRTLAFVIVGFTLVAYVVLSICIRRLRLRGDGQRLAGLFVGLDLRSCLRLSTAWLKLTLFVAMLIVGKPAESSYYIAFLTVVAANLLFSQNLGGVIFGVCTSLLQGIGLWSCSGILGYLQEIRYVQGYFYLYRVVAVVLILYSAALFLKEVIAVSGERKWFDENGETE